MTGRSAVTEVDTRRLRAPTPGGRYSPTGRRSTSLNAVTGTPVELDGEGLPDVAPSVEGALEAITAAAPALGLAADQVEFVPDPTVLRTSTGASVVHAQQHHLGIPMFDMVRTVVFGPDGRVRSILGENHALAGPLSPLRAAGPAPAVGVVEAAVRAAAHLAAGDGNAALTTWQPRVLSTFALPARPAVLDRGPFEREVPAHLVYFGGDAADTRLAWHLVLELPVGQYVVIVDAGGRPGAVCYCRRTTHDLRPVVARVYPEHPDAGDRTVTLPPPVAEYGLPVPPGLGFPRAWCLGPDTDGNFARVTDGDGVPLAGRPDGTTLTFAGDDPLGLAQCMVNAFYLCSLAHDLFLLLGFDECSKNFEMIGTGTGGVDGDPVVVRVRDDSDGGEAHFTCRPDGEPPIMVLGRNRATGRPAALDADVVLHEYVHGVTTRLVGGLGNPSSLEPVQSAALGEGWSDYFALTLQNHLHGTDRTRLGTWSTASAGGLRLHAYDEHFPDGFGAIGTGRYVEPHAIGEIWAAALVQADRELAALLGRPARCAAAGGHTMAPAGAGRRLGWRVVLDGLRLTRSSPSLLDARNAVLAAAADIDAAGDTPRPAGVRAEDVYRRVFARFGMGRTADTNGPYLEGIVPCGRT